jgi:hypothetical protein
MEIIKETTLKNGLRIQFYDLTNRYFGDYHRVCVLAILTIPLLNLIDEPLKSRGLRMFGEALKVEKRFERMGVPSQRVLAVREELVDHFLRHASKYLSKPEFPQKLVAAELNKPRVRRYNG